MSLPRRKEKGKQRATNAMLTGGLSITRFLLRGCGITTKGQLCSFYLEPYDRWDPDRGERQSVSSSIPVFWLQLWQLVWHLLLPLPDGWPPFCLNQRWHTSTQPAVKGPDVEMLCLCSIYKITVVETQRGWGMGDHFVFLIHKTKDRNLFVQLQWLASQTTGRTLQHMGKNVT